MVCMIEWVKQIINLIATLVIAVCISLIIYFYDTIRLDFYYILAGIIVAVAGFMAGYHEAKEKYGSK